jgi:hypothetical protein
MRTDVGVLRWITSYDMRKHSERQDTCRLGDEKGRLLSRRSMCTVYIPRANQRTLRIEEAIHR